MATIDQLKSWIAEAEAKRHEVALGDTIIEIWRDGRRIKKTFSTIEQLNDYIAELQRELAAAEADDAGKRRRRPMRLAYRN